MKNIIIWSFLIVFSMTSVFADSNGIWTYAEDIRAGTFGLDENNSVGSNYTFDDFVYFNKNIFAGSIIDRDNSSFLINPSGASYLGGVFADAFYTRGGGNYYYLRPAGTSRINRLEVEGDITYKGELLENSFVKHGENNSISSQMIQPGAVDNSHIDAGLPLDSTDVTTKEYVDAAVADAGGIEELQQLISQNNREYVTVMNSDSSACSCPSGYSNFFRTTNFQDIINIKGSSWSFKSRIVSSLRGTSRQSTLSNPSADYSNSINTNQYGTPCAQICSKSFSQSTSVPRIFVTSTGYKGDLGQKAGADLKCQQRAEAARLGGSFQAFIPNLNQRVDETFLDTIYENMKGQVVIPTFTNYNLDKTGWQTLDNSINYDEYGRDVTSNVRAWTGIRSNGERATSNSQGCYDFRVSISSYGGIYGDVTQTDSSWFNDGTASCNNRYRLICIEQ